MDIELSVPLKDIEGLNGYGKLKALIRLNGCPIGYLTAPVVEGRCHAAEICRQLVELHNDNILGHLLRKGLRKPIGPEGLKIDELIKLPVSVENGPWPLVTVAVCTRDRTEDLAVCLESLKKLKYPNLDFLIVDNAPKTPQTKNLLENCDLPARYVCEPRPGLDWARNRAIIEARGEIIAFTDDDVVVDPNWVNALADVFTNSPEVMAVTGLVVPFELETKAQFLFELYGGFGRGFKRKWYVLGPERDRGKSIHIGAGIFGTGANMAYRRGLFEQIGAFDPALDVGTVTNGGGDLEMFFRVLQEGYILVYEPKAVVRHRHRREYNQLKAQLTNNGIGLYSFFVRSCLAYPKQMLSILRFGLWWLWKGHFRRLLIGLTQPYSFPLDLILAEIRGCFIGLSRYFKARHIAANIDPNYNQETKSAIEKVGDTKRPKSLRPVAVRTINLSHTIKALDDIHDYRRVQVFVKLGATMLGKLDISNSGYPISATRLRDALIEELALELIEPGSKLTRTTVRSQTITALKRHCNHNAIKPSFFPSTVSVSIVVATLDRPDGLRECLKCLLAQKTSRKIEIIVVDNHPASGLTPPVVAEFPGVRIVAEPRRGLAYARNAGFAVSSGSIIATTDDDVILPSIWLEKLVAPFIQAEVMAVTGNVLPLALETSAQVYFEIYGGLGRGFQRCEYDTKWFESFRFGAVQTWEIGATANAAFRATIFSDTQIGLMDEALGPGMPSGVGEDTYLFYKILKEGYTVVYEPSAYAWHQHRSGIHSLQRQLYNYSKGHVAYHLTTMLRDRDLRALYHLLLALPKFHFKRLIQRLLGRGDYPLKLILIEFMGNLTGPFALLKSRWRVKREGQSRPYIPVAQRITSPKKRVEDSS